MKERVFVRTEKGVCQSCESEMRRIKMKVQYQSKYRRKLVCRTAFNALNVGIA